MQRFFGENVSHFKTNYWKWLCLGFEPKVWSHLRGSQYASKLLFSLLIEKQKKESYEATTILEPWKLSITLIFTCFLRDTPWLLIHHTRGRWFFADSIYEGSNEDRASSSGVLLRRFFEKWLIKNLSKRSLLSKCSTLSFQFAWNIHRDSISCD